MKKAFFIVWLFAMLSANVFAGVPYVVVLGTAQDAGAPQMGCTSPFCERAWKNIRLRNMITSIALVDPDASERWIFDATPDLPSQFQALKEATNDYSNSLSGIFLTHAHIGHYTGLMYLGRESMNTERIPVYAMPRMAHFLTGNGPWSQLVTLRNIVIRPISDGRPVKLSGGLTVEPFLVPHRDEFSETVGYRISRGTRSLVFIPDIDKWQKWDKKLGDIVKNNDFVLIDGTFFADGEIPRPISEVPHPFVTETMGLLTNLDANAKRRVHFIHFNHSNPLIQGNAAKIRLVEKKGFRIASRGQIFSF